MILPSQHISIAITKPPAIVYEYATNPQNLPEWATGLSGSKIEKEGDHWISLSHLGKVKIKFAEKNSLGVMDHDVTLPNGETTRNPFRVVANGDGSEVSFIVFKSVKMTEAQFSKDAQQIRTDLETLKKKIEK